MKIDQFARKHNIPILGPESLFPDRYITHAVSDTSVLDEKYLLCSDLLGKTGFICEIDKYLGETKYVFFAIGKGYLKSKKSIGLIYDPLVLASIPGANIVENDLLYQLNETDILHTFCEKYFSQIIGIIEYNSPRIIAKIEKDAAISSDNYNKPKLCSIFTDYLRESKSLLIYSPDDQDHRIFITIFDYLLTILPLELQTELKNSLERIKSRIIWSSLPAKIEEIFRDNETLLNKFFDQTSEEILPELRLPNQHLIEKGLIAIYQSD